MKQTASRNSLVWVLFYDTSVMPVLSGDLIERKQNQKRNVSVSVYIDLSEVVRIK